MAKIVAKNMISFDLADWIKVGFQSKWLNKQQLAKIAKLGRPAKIPPRGVGRPRNNIFATDKIILTLYQHANLTTYDIAKLLHISPFAVRNVLKKHNLYKIPTELGTPDVNNESL